MKYFYYQIIVRALSELTFKYESNLQVDFILGKFCNIKLIVFLFTQSKKEANNISLFTICVTIEDRLSDALNSNFLQSLHLLFFFPIGYFVFFISIMTL